MRALACPASLKGVLAPVEAAAALAAGLRGAGAEASSCRSPTAARGRRRCSRPRSAASGGRRAARDPLGRPVDGALARAAGRDRGRRVGARRSGSAARARRSSTRSPRRARASASCSSPRSPTGRRRCSSASAARRRSTAAPACLAVVPSWPVGVPLRVACDVRNPLLGERGAARVFGPQKGAGPAAVEELERRLAGMDAARAVPRPARRRRGRRPRRGARVARRRARRGRGARPRPDRLRRAVRASADLVVTGEGTVDASTFEGKAPGAVVARCRRLGVPCVLFGGQVTTCHLPVEARALSGRPERAREDLVALGAELAATGP